MAQPSVMELWLNTGTDEERAQKIVSLGVERETAELKVKEKVKWRPVRSESHRETAILFLPCGALSDTSFLYLLESTDHVWHVTDRVGFDCHYDDSVSFDVVELRSPYVGDVLVHHECEAHGTGLVQQNFNVFAVVSSRFKLVLNTEEIFKASGYPAESHEFNQRSSFTIIPTTRSVSRVIQETRCTTENGRLTIQKREFRWSPAKFRFLPSPFVKVEATGAKSRAACR
jgi:hypothetical protein